MRAEVLDTSFTIAVHGFQTSLDRIAAKHEPFALADTAEYALAKPGKQLRPRLVHATARAAGGGDPRRVQAAADAVDLVHVTTLVHDDVIDGSKLRRGRPTVGADQGPCAATTAGGWLYAKAINAATACGAEAVELLAKTVCELCDGQLLETQDLFSVDRSIARYEAAIAGKTASLFACAAGLGGLAVGASAPILSGFQRFGHRFGMAFQAADDILDLLGRVPGKAPGDDLRQGVFTLPVLYAAKHDRRLRERLRRGVSAEDAPAIAHTVRELGGINVALEYCRRHQAGAARVARELTLDPVLVDYAADALDPLLEAAQ